MNAEAGPELEGLTQEEAGERILAWLRERDQLEKRESYRHTVALCDRCKNRIEPLISPQWWCSMEELKQPGARGDAGRPRDLPPRVAAPLRGLLARGRARLEHLAPDLVGAPAAALAVPGRPLDVRGGGARRVRRVRLGRADPQRGRPRHLVLLGALAVRDARLARRHRVAPHLLPRRPEHDRAGHHPPLGEPDDLLRPRADGRRPVQGRRHPLARARADRRADVEEPRHRDEPARADRGLRRRRDPLRADEDGLLAGRGVLRGRDRGGAEARAEALERGAPDPDERRRRDARRAAAGDRGALDPRAHLADPARGRALPRRVRLLASRRRALPPDLRRLLRLVPRGDQAPARRARRPGRPRSPRSSGC